MAREDSKIRFPKEETSAVKILRDTGASQSLLLAETLPFSEKSSTGTCVLIKGVNSLEYSPVPLHTVYLSSDVVSGPVNVGLGSSLPFGGVQRLLGNDLAGDKVVINPSVNVLKRNSYLVKDILLIYYSMSQISELSLIALVN